jgi:hypothetical protein
MPGLLDIATHNARIVKYYYSGQDCEILPLIMPGLLKYLTILAK